MGSSFAADSDSLLMPPIAPELDRRAFAPSPDSISNPSSNHDISGRQNFKPDYANAADKAKDLLRQALKSYAEGNTALAESNFKKVLTIDHANTDAYYNLGAIAESRGDLATALNYYQSALKINPADTDLDNAVTTVQSKLADASLKQAANAQLAQQAKSSQDSRVYSEQLKSRVNEAALAYKQGKFDDAIRTLQNVARQVPQQADVQYALAQCFKAKGQYPEALSALNTALAIDPSNQLYKNAVNDLSNQKVGGAGTGSGSSGNFDTIASDSTNNSATSAPVGQITPFTGGDSNNNGWQSAGAPGDFHSNGYRSGFARHNYNDSTTASSRIKRVAIGAASGVAIGLILGGGGSYNSRARGALVGGTIGGLLGLLSGR